MNSKKMGLGILISLILAACGGDKNNKSDEIPNSPNTPTPDETIPPLTTENPFLGILDSSFGNGGISDPVFDSELYEFFYSATDFEITNTGDILFTGKGWIYDPETGGAPLYANMISKVNFLTGTADLSFGKDGSISFYRDDYLKVKTEGSRKIKLLEDGSLLSAGLGGVIKLKNTLEFDPTFGSDLDGFSDFKNSYSSSVQWGTTIKDILVLPDGKYIICGDGLTEIESGHRSVAFIGRYNSDGTVDSSFGTDGAIFLDFNSGVDLAEGSCSKVALTAAGDYVFFGQYSYVENESLVPSYGFVFGKLDQNGQLYPSIEDPVYGFNRINSSSDMVLFSSKVVSDNDGNIFASVTESSSITYEARTLILKINNNAELDQSFGANGVYSFQLGTYNPTLNLTPSGDILVAQNNSSNKIEINRLSSAGILYNSFGTEGRVVVNSRENPVDIAEVGSNVVILTDKARLIKLK